MLVKNLLQLVIGRLRLLPYDVSKVEGVFPEDEDQNHFEEESDISDKLNKSAQLVLITAILFVFLAGAAIDDEELDKVIYPTDSNQQDQSTEGLTSDGSWVIQHVDGQGSDSQTEEAVTLQHLEKDQDQEDENDSFCDF